MLNDIDSWRWARTEWHIGMVYFKWFMLGFVAYLAAWYLLREIVIRKLERENRRLSLLILEQSTFEKHTGTRAPAEPILRPNTLF